ncbi:hypothetical protein HMPREF9135_1132, partial [Segatella baroniae F0067]
KGPLFLLFTFLLFYLFTFFITFALVLRRKQGILFILFYVQNDFQQAQ